ncbi:MAG: hypothetical protein ACRDCW_06660 [Sarcina sp.]
MNKIGRYEFIGILLEIINKNWQDVFQKFFNDEWVETTDYMQNSYLYLAFERDGYIDLETQEDELPYRLTIEKDSKKNTIKWKIEPVQVVIFEGELKI